jgi:hypothetical protein
MAHGQDSGIRSCRWRALRVSRAATCSSRYLRAFGSHDLRLSGRASRRSQAVRSAARVTRASQAGLIAYSRDGSRPRPVSLACRIRSSTLLVHGVGSVPGLQERQLPEAGVGGEGWVAPPVLVLEQGQLRPRVWPFAADDDPHRFRPARQGEQAGELGDVGVLADLTVGVQGDLPRGRRHHRDGGPDRVGDREADRVLQVVAAFWRPGRSASRAGRGRRQHRPRGPAAVHGSPPAAGRSPRSAPRCGRSPCSSPRSPAATSSPAARWCCHTGPRLGGTRMSSSGFPSRPPSRSGPAPGWRPHPAPPGPATVAAGGRLPGNSPQTCLRVRARARSSRLSRAGVSSSNARHTVVGDATGPSTWAWWRNVAMSAIASPPAAIIVATSTNTRPRSCPAVNPRRVNADDSSPVRPIRSASSRTDTAPAWATTPDPSAVTDNPRAHDVAFTHQVPVPFRILSVANPSIPLRDRHFGASKAVSHRNS